jgi:hypothetical protein
MSFPPVGALPGPDTHGRRHPARREGGEVTCPSTVGTAALRPRSRALPRHPAPSEGTRSPPLADSIPLMQLAVRSRDFESDSDSEQNAGTDNWPEAGFLDSDPNSVSIHISGVAPPIRLAPSQFYSPPPIDSAPRLPIPTLLLDPPRWRPPRRRCCCCAARRGRSLWHRRGTRASSPSSCRRWRRLRPRAPSRRSSNTG